MQHQNGPKHKECSIFRKAKGAREARKETLTLELNANVN
jgi:hypothetical protein